MVCYKMNFIIFMLVPKLGPHGDNNSLGSKTSVWTKYYKEVGGDRGWTACERDEKRVQN